MTPRSNKKKVMSAREHDAYVRTALKRIDAGLRRIDKQRREMTPLLRELRKIADE
jgi:hypothetical protein